MTVFSCILVCLPEIHSKQEGGRTPAHGSHSGNRTTATDGGLTNERTHTDTGPL